MQKNTVQEAANYIARNRRHRTWKKVVTALACVVVFCTIYVLILPAVTLEKTPQCGKPEHRHSEVCYTQVTAENRNFPICTLESLDLHKHTDTCLDENGEYCCGYSDFVVHEHDDTCFDADGNLWCPLPEVKAYTHSESCYTQPETEPAHIHTDECYATERGALICQLEESTGHRHTDDCYAWVAVLTCDRPAEQVLVCDKEEIILHEHNSDCFDENGSLICGKVQVLEHVHTEACFEAVDTLICDLEEHTHSAACSVIGLIEALPTQQSVEERMAAFEKAGDEAGNDAYLTELQAQVQEAYDAYAALPEEEKAKVTNIGRLTELEWLRGLSLQETAAAVTVTNEDGSAAGAALWRDDTGVAQKQLKAALFSVDQGYAIRSVEYYQITGLTGSKATVTYNSGSGLSAADAGAQVFVYDLGVDGKATPQSCTIENATQENQLFKSFDFGIPEGSDGESHIYAFISASPATLLDEMGIYLGTKLEDGHWIAMDGPDEATANVKVDIQLTGALTALPNCYPFILKVNEGEDFYPDMDAVRRAVGEVNDVQCYKIHWVERKDDGTYNFETGMEVGNGKNSRIQLEYLKDAAQLKGPKGGRKLRVFSSQSEDGKTLVEISNSVQNVQLMDENYKGFTFNVTEPCPYVFVSEKVELGYIDALSISTIIDGSDPFDGKDEPGYDSGPGNKIVRSYDTIQYNLDATFGARQEEVTAETVNMYFELTLRKSATAARFDISKMLWLGKNYSVEYLDDAGNVIMVMDHDGKYYLPKTENGEVVRDDHGFALPDKTKDTVSMNAQVNGSTEGANSYKVASGGVAMQRLVGWTELTAKEGDSILSGTQSFPMAVQVRNADNGEIFAPSFRMWLEGNEENYGPETASPEGLLLPAKPDEDNVVDINDPENVQYQVRVSAGTNFNVQLKKNTDMSYKNWFDFSSGLAVAEPARTELERLAKLEENRGKSNPAEFTDSGKALSAEKKDEYANYRYGRITCYGITLQLYNDTDNKNDLETKGFRGLSLPVGDITFDLNFSSTVTAGGTTLSSDEYTAILWDYNENIPANTSYSDTYKDPGRGTLITPKDGLGNGGRNLYWDGETRSPYAKGGAPSNYMVYHGGCYYGGNWALVDENGQTANALNKIYQIANPKVVTGSGAGTTYHFSVSDYDFDFDDQYFPTQDAGNSGKVPGYDTYARCFSAGCIQVLSVFPRVQKVSEAEIFLNTTVSNLELETRAGQKLEPKAGDDTKIQHEVNKNDNTRSDQIVLYAPGNLTKGNSFNGLYKGNPPKTTSDGFLGTEYWTTSYDCSAFAGDDIWIISYGMMASGSDYRTRSMNLLQLFDSRALSIRGEPTVYQSWDEKFDKKGTAAFLYAADPDHPEGYDTNKDGILAYMNSVREEDLVYSTATPDADGFITVNGKRLKCVGVLMELRNCDLLGGKYQYMRIPVKVNGDDQGLVGNTVATVNTFRVWSEDLGDITWANGQWNGTKNVLDGFPKPTNTYDSDSYSGELANSQKSSPPYYVKTEYEDGLQVKGTHAGGTLAGNSLLILNYKAGINIGVDNKESTGMISYNLGDGESVVDYRLKNIRTEISDLTGQTDKPVTDLTINTVLDEGYTGGTQRISVSGGSYRISGYAVDAAGNVANEETNISIGTDPENPTVLEFADSDGARHRIKIYAQMGANSQSVKFVIQDAPVGLHLPDITFQANFAAVTALKNNDTIKTSTYISGTSDKRAYDQTKGNTDNITVGVVLRSGTNLTKAVNTRYMELDGTIIYDVTYTNSGADTLAKIYFYDLLPNSSDIRGSKFTGDVVLRDVKVTSSKDAGAVPAGATVYYSGTEYTTLYNKVSKFGEGATTADRVADVEAMLEDTRFFKPLAHVTNGVFSYDSAFDGKTPEEKTEMMSHVTGLYAKVENLHTGQTVTLQITVQTKNNKADDWYKNIANSWIAGSGTLPLTSNKVETQTVSRTISGVVWHDKNLNGIRDEGEPMLQGVTATLFKKGADNAYAICEKHVTGKDISPVTTGTDGAYSFNNLAAGDYIVAFSGPILEKFTDATSYQKNGQNDANTNDGKAVPKGGESAFDPNAYAYYIHFSGNGPEILLHSIAEMGTVTLNNGVEMYLNQDLGLIVTTHELPETGGVGTTPYIMGGLLLMTASAIFLRYRRKRGRKEDFTSS